MRTAAVVLAAGRSERMGRNKLLLEVAGRPILDWLLEALDASAVNEVIVVLGHRPEELRPIATSHGAVAVLNPSYDDGMTSSFMVGLSRVSADAAFLVLGDQLGLEARLLERMAAAMEADPEELIVSPAYRGRLGHPVLFRRALFPEILGLTEGENVRDVVLRHGSAHRLVEAGVWCVLDIDTPEDFDRAKRLFEASRGVVP